MRINEVNVLYVTEHDYNPTAAKDNDYSIYNLKEMAYKMLIESPIVIAAIEGKERILLKSRW